MSSEPSLPTGRGGPASAPTTLGPRRLHRAGIALAALGSLKEVLLAIVVGILLRAGSGGMGSAFALVLALGGAAAAIVVGYLRWTNETYEIADSSLRHRSGVISPDETSVPLARVQAIDTTQGPIQRLFGVQALHVQTAGGGAGGEVVLTALDDQAVRELRAAFGLPDPASLDLAEWRLSTRGLLITALTAPQFGVVLPLVGGLAAALDNVILNAADRSLLDRAPTDAGGIALVVLVLAAAAWLLSFAGAIVAFAGFSVVSDGDRLRIRRGLLRRRAASVPVPRVHGVDVLEGVLRRPFRLAAVRVEITGYREEGSAAQTLFPAVHVREIDGLLSRFVPAFGGTLGVFERPPSRALRRYALPEATLGALVGAAGAIAWNPAWPLIPLLALLGALDGFGRYRSAGWRLADGAIVVRQRLRALGRRTLIARANRLQEHSVTQSPLQRRADLAHFALAVGSGRRGRVAHLELTSARELFDRLRAGGG